MEKNGMVKDIIKKVKLNMKLKMVMDILKNIIMII